MYDDAAAVWQHLYVNHPLGATLQAASLQIIEPILVGNPEKILRSFLFARRIFPGSVSSRRHTATRLRKAVALEKAGEAAALMKGSLHTDELMGAVVRRDGGLRTARRVSHCFVMDVPDHETVLIMTDAAVNIAPTLEEKRDITQNAIDLAHALRIETVRVAIVSAMETINTKVPSTIEAAALCKMADRGQITGALVDGPLALDNGIDLGAAKIKMVHISDPILREDAGCPKAVQSKGVANEHCRFRLT